MAPQVKREDLVVPYIHVPLQPSASSSGIVQQSMPMAAMFMKNKLLSWFSLMSGVQAVLNQFYGVPTPEGATSGHIQVLVAFAGLFVCYLDLLYPGASGGRPRAVQKVAETVAETVAAATGSA